MKTSLPISAVAAALTLAMTLAPAAPTAALADDAAGDPLARQEARGAERAALFEALAAARSEPEARAVERRIWAFWGVGPTEAASASLEEAKTLMRARALETAIARLDVLTADAPNWAEAWNLRATVLFLQGDFDQSLRDVERTLALEPKHFGALAGRAQIFLRQGRLRLFRSSLREAIAIHPYLRERHLLGEDPAAPAGGGEGAGDGEKI